MAKVEFEKVNNKDYTVLIGGEKYGILKFEDDFEDPVWVLWPDSIDDAVDYFKNLDETKKAIKEELENDSEFKEIKLADLGDFDIIQVDDGTVKLRYHRGVIGSNKTIYVTDEGLEVLEDLLAEVNNENSSVKRDETIWFIKNEFFR